MAVLHEAVRKKACVDSTVVTIGLLWDRGLSAADEGPEAFIRMVESSEMFVSEEGKHLFGIFEAVVPWEVVGDPGVEICDGFGGGVGCDAGPVVAIPVEGKDESPVAEGGSVGELVAPAVEPSF